MTDANAFRVSNYGGRVYLGKGSVEQPDALSPGDARELAAALTDHADAVDSESEAQVQKLAALLYDLRQGVCGVPGPYDLQCARAILAAGYTPPDGES